MLATKCYRSLVDLAPRKCLVFLALAENKNNQIVLCSTAKACKRQQMKMAVGWNPGIATKV